MKSTIKEDIRLVRIDHGNRDHFIDLLSSVAYFAVTQTGFYTIGAVAAEGSSYTPAPDPDAAEDDPFAQPILLPKSGPEPLGIIQFYTDGRHGTHSRAFIEDLQTVNDDTGEAAKDALLREAIRILSKAGISVLHKDLPAEDTVGKEFFTQAGFTFENAETLHTLLPIDVLSEDRDVSLPDPPASYSAPEMIPVGLLGKLQQNELVRHLCETPDPKIASLVKELKDTSGEADLTAFAAVRHDKPVGACILKYRHDRNSGICFVETAYLRSFDDDINCILSLVEKAAEILAEDPSGEKIWISVNTTYAPGIRLLKQIFPDLTSEKFLRGARKASR